MTRSFLTVLILAAAVSAQTVTLRGEVEDDADNTIILSCTPVQLVSGGADLNAVMGEEVIAQGTVIGPDLVSVTSVELNTAIFDVSNNVQLGGEIDFEVDGPVGHPVQIYAAAASDFIIVRKMGLFLDPASLTLVLEGTIPADGKLQIVAQVPNDPALANLDLFFQAVRFPPGSKFILGNPDCVTIQP